MYTNFNGLKMHIISESEKSSCSENLQQKSSCEVSNKTHRLWDLYEITHSEIKALVFSRLSIQLGVVHFVETLCTVISFFIEWHY